MSGDTREEQQTRMRALALQAIVLASVVALAFLRTDGLRERVSLAEGRRFDSEAAFFGHHEVLGGDYRLVKRIRREYPAGTPVSVLFEDSYPHTELVRITRLWLALLPDYPISGDAPLVICPPRSCPREDGAEFLANGERLSLVRRAGE